MITAKQCRAARAWLDMTQHELAVRAGVSISTIRDFETGQRQPIKNNLLAIETVFDQEGIYCLSNGSGLSSDRADPATGDRA